MGAFKKMPTPSRLRQATPRAYVLCCSWPPPQRKQAHYRARRSGARAASAPGGAAWHRASSAQHAAVRRGCVAKSMAPAPAGWRVELPIAVSSCVCCKVCHTCNGALGGGQRAPGRQPAHAPSTPAIKRTSHPCWSAASNSKCARFLRSMGLAGVPVPGPGASQSLGIN